MQELVRTRNQRVLNRALQLRNQCWIFYLNRCLSVHSCQLPASSEMPSAPGSSCKLAAGSRQLNLERETGIEPATNSLEGCDSTTELLPQKKLLAVSC